MSVITERVAAPADGAFFDTAVMVCDACGAKRHLAARSGWTRVELNVPLSFAGRMSADFCSIDCTQDGLAEVTAQ